MTWLNTARNSTGAQNRGANTVNEGSLFEASDSDLAALFRASSPGDVPIGPLDGTAIIAAGTRATKILAALVRAAAWQGKVVDPGGKSLVNRITPLRLRAIRAAVYPGASWVDGADCIVIDYSKTSLVARGVRDEIRLVAPRLYLGVVWLWRRRVAWFSLRVPNDR